MTARNALARIVKLETGRRKHDQIMVVWRMPGADVREAVNSGRFGSGDKVICAEWFGDGPPPSPHAYNAGKGITKLADELQDSMRQSRDRVVSHGDDKDRLSRGFNPFPRGISQDKMQLMTDGELDYALLGVTP